MEEHYIWLFNKSDGRGFWWAFLVSFLLHGLMFAVMATTSIFYPPAGDSTNLDVVWLYPPFLIGGKTESSPPLRQPPPQEKASPSPEESAGKALSRKAAPAEPEPAEETAEIRNVKPVPPPPLPPAQEEVKPATATSAPLTPEPEPEPETEPEMRLPAGSPPTQTAEVKAEPREKAAAKETASPPEKVQPAGKEPETKIATPVDKRTIATSAEKPAMAPEAKQPTTVAVPTPPRKETVQNQIPQPSPRQTPVNESPPLPTTAKAIPGKETTIAAAAPSQATRTSGIPGAKRKAVTEKPIEPSSNPKPAAVEKPAEAPSVQSAGPKGIFAPPPSGDLKIEITGPDEALRAVMISVTFRAYSKTRHNRPMTKADACNFQTLTPKMVRTAKNTLQAVIEVAEEGFYDFRNVSDAADSAKVAFSVKIYENSGRAKTKPAPPRKIGVKGSIAKVLMPEGILWDDQSAFSGDMENSDSITRFNAETGLVWKEYKEQ